MVILSVIYTTVCPGCTEIYRRQGVGSRLGTVARGINRAFLRTKEGIDPAHISIAAVHAGKIPGVNYCQ